MLEANKNSLRSSKQRQAIFEDGSDGWYHKVSQQVKSTINSWYQSALQNEKVQTFLGIKQDAETKPAADPAAPADTDAPKAADPAAPADAPKAADPPQAADPAAPADAPKAEEAAAPTDEGAGEQPAAKEEPEPEEKPANKANEANDFQQASYFAAAFIFIVAITCFNSPATIRRGVFLGLGGLALATWASFFTSAWDIGDSFRWVLSMLVGGALGLYKGLDAKAPQLGQTICLIQASIGAACFLLGLAEYQRYSYLDLDFEGNTAIQTMFVCLCGSALLASATTAYLKLDKNKIAKEPLVIIGKHRNTVNSAILITLAVLSLLYVIFKWGWILWTVVFLSLYIFWGLTVSAVPKEMNVIIPFQTILTGATISFVGFMLQMHYLLLVGALCLTGGYKTLVSAEKALGATVVQVFFKSWKKETAESVASNIEEYGYPNQLIGEEDLEQEFLTSDRIAIVAGDGLYTTGSTKSLSQITEALTLLGKKVNYVVHPNSGVVPGQISAVLVSQGIPYNTIKLNKKSSFQSYDLAVVIGVYSEVDPDNLTLHPPKPTCQVWEAERVIYVETLIEKTKGNGLFDKQNVKVLKGDCQKILANILKNFQKKGLVDMEPEERELLLKGGSLLSGSSNISLAQKIEIETLVSQATKHLGVYNESGDKENRVAVTPAIVKSLLKNGIQVWIEKDAGKASGYSDEQYTQSGARVTSANEIFQNSHFQIFVSEMNDAKVNQISKSTKLVVAPLGNNKEILSKLCKKDQITVLDLSQITSHSNKSKKINSAINDQTLLAHRSVIEGFFYLNKLAPPLNNIAGRSSASQVLVLGADELGLTVASVAKQSGAAVTVFDRRDGHKSVITKSGFSAISFVYSDMQSNPNEIKEVQDKALVDALKGADLVFTAITHEDGSAPKELNELLISHLRRGAVIVDLVAQKGGNTTLTQLNKVNYDANLGVTVIGYTQLAYAQKLNRVSSELHSQNVSNLFNQLFQSPSFKQAGEVDLSEPSIKESCWVLKGRDVSESRHTKEEEEVIANEQEIPEAPTPKAEEQEQLIQAQPDASAAQQSDNSIKVDQQGGEKEPEKKPTFTERVSATIKKTGELIGEGTDMAVNLVSDALGEDHEETFNKNPGMFAIVVTSMVFILCLILGIMTDSAFITQLGIFILAVFVGNTLINQTDRGLTIALIVFLQALSGSIGVACTHVFSHGYTSFFTGFSLIALIGNGLAIFCSVVGFTVAMRLAFYFTPAELKSKEEIF